MFLGIIFIVCVLVYVLLNVMIKRIKDRTKYMKGIPGPKPFFLFGNTLDFIAGPTVFIQNLQRYLNKYGDTILVHPGAFNWGIITIDYELTEFLFNSSVFIDKAQEYTFLNGWLGEGLLTSSGSKWKSRRKVLTPSFHFSILQQFTSVFDTVGDNLIRRLKKEVGKDSVEISKIVSLYALDVICEAAMGVKINAIDQENSKYVTSIKKMCNIIIERTFSPLHPIFYPLTWNYYKEKRVLKVIHEHVDGIISRRSAEYNIKKNEGQAELADEHGIRNQLAFLDLLLETKIDGRPLSKEELRDEVNTFMFEGHDTTSSAITFCLLMIASHPDVQEKIIEEQITIFGQTFRTAKSTYKELNEMKYLELVIKETLRLYPSVPFIGRKLVKDLEFKGTLYPQGLSIMLFPYAFQRNPAYFPDPEKFLPERFENINKRLPFAYTPFSAGPRNCIGQKFALLEMLSTISKVVRNFELAPAKPEHKFQLAAEVILISKNGVKISLRHRKENQTEIF